MFSTQCWSFIQCCPRNSAMYSWNKLCNVETVKVKPVLRYWPVLQSTITACTNNKNRQCNFINFIYPYSVFLHHIFIELTAFFIPDGEFPSLCSLEATPNIANTNAHVFNEHWIDNCLHLCKFANSLVTYS